MSASDPEASLLRPRNRRPPRKKRSRKEEERRMLLRSALAVAGLALLQPLAWLPIVRRWRARLRPPGALEEKDFLSSCIKCGQCVQVCPVQAIRLADATDGMGLGTPYIEARDQACDFSCDALSCILACPTGALDHSIGAKEEVDMGFARLARPESCLARQGKGFSGRARGEEHEGRLRYEHIDRWHPIPVRDHPYDRPLCDLCVIECPIGTSALVLIAQTTADGESYRIPEVRDGCVGCGVCEMICPPDPPAIVVEVREPRRKRA